MAYSLQSNECYLFFGVSGAGKSATINKICRETKCEVGDGETSETSNCKLVSVDNKNSIFYGKNLLDMQGYNDSRPNENQEKIFEMTKLYFMGNNIQKVKCIIFVVSMSDARTNFYLRFIDFLNGLFSNEQVTKNMIVLLTKSDRLSSDERQRKFENIKANIAEIENKKGYTMEIVEWSNANPLLDQEKKLLTTISKLPGFNPTQALQTELKKIENEVEKQYQAQENITVVKHAAQQELKEFKKDRIVEEFVPVRCDEVIEKNIPAQKEIRQIEVRQTTHFQGELFCQGDSAAAGIMRGLGRIGGIVGTNYLLTGFTGRDTKVQTKRLQFDGKVISVKLSKTADDVVLLDALGYTIDSQDPRCVTVTAKFSWGGGVVMTWDFDLEVTATVEQNVVLKDSYTDKVVVAKERIETKTKTITDVDKQLIEVAPAREEKIYKKTKDEIRKSIIHERILKMT